MYSFDVYFQDIETKISNTMNYEWHHQSNWSRNRVFIKHIIRTNLSDLCLVGYNSWVKYDIFYLRTAWNWICHVFEALQKCQWHSLYILGAHHFLPFFHFFGFFFHFWHYMLFNFKFASSSAIRFLLCNFPQKKKRLDDPSWWRNSLSFLLKLETCFVTPQKIPEIAFVHHENHKKSAFSYIKWSSTQVENEKPLKTPIHSIQPKIV